MSGSLFSSIWHSPETYIIWTKMPAVHHQSIFINRVENYDNIKVKELLKQLKANM
jgi:hypothetical protein